MRPEQWALIQGNLGNALQILDGRGTVLALDPTSIGRLGGILEGPRALWCLPMATAGLLEGTTFASDFRVIHLLGRGGMGAVYEVEQLSTGRRLALKQMLPEHLPSQQLRDKFEQEMRISSRIESDHIAHVVSAGVDATSGVPWFAMELLRGETLEERIVRVGAMRPSDVLHILEQICHALGAAHARGIVHRDLKPDNIFLAQQRVVGRAEIVKVLDFGVAKVLAEAGTTQTGMSGTPPYMAPEQFDGSGIRTQTDLWALALIAFRMVTAGYYWRVAEGEATPRALMYQICFGELPAASARAVELGVRIPLRFDACFARSVTRDRSERYETVAQFIDDLRLALAEPTPIEIVRTTDDLGKIEKQEVSSAVSAPQPLTSDVASSRQPSAKVAGNVAGTKNTRQRTAVVAFCAVAMGLIAAALTRYSVSRPEHAPSTETASSTSSTTAGPTRPDTLPPAADPRDGASALFGTKLTFRADAPPEALGSQSLGQGQPRSVPNNPPPAPLAVDGEGAGVPVVADTPSETAEQDKTAAVTQTKTPLTELLFPGSNDLLLEGSRVRTAAAPTPIANDLPITPKLPRPREVRTSDGQELRAAFVRATAGLASTVITPGHYALTAVYDLELTPTGQHYINAQGYMFAKTSQFEGQDFTSLYGAILIQPSNGKPRYVVQRGGGYYRCKGAEFAGYFALSDVIREWCWGAKHSGAAVGNDKIVIFNETSPRFEEWTRMPDLRLENESPLKHDVLRQRGLIRTR